MKDSEETLGHDLRGPCTLENCGHMRQLDAIVDFLGMARGTRSVLDELRSRVEQEIQTTVEAFIERVEITRQKYVFCRERRGVSRGRGRFSHDT